jgi:glyoxylate/hydroxypyruvate reductase A
MILLVNSGGKAAVPEWQAEFRAVAPHLDVRWWQDPAVDLADAAYAFGWAPAPGWLARLPGLRLILSSGAGVDHITSDPDWPRHVGIVRMGGAETAQRMAEWVCLAALALLRDLPTAIAGQAARRWTEMPAGRTAPETRVGIMGLGNLGAAAAAMLLGLGFRVSGWSRTAKRLPGVDCYAGQAERDAFLAGADILVCLLPGTPDTRGGIRAETIALLPPGAGVVNAGRGGHVVLADLLAALDAGRLSGAVLDVFEAEPLPGDAAVWGHSRVIVTPHVASLASRRARAGYVAEAIAAFERGDVLCNLGAV